MFLRLEAVSCFFRSMLRKEHEIACHRISIVLWLLPEATDCAPPSAPRLAWHVLSHCFAGWCKRGGNRQASTELLPDRTSLLPAASRSTTSPAGVASGALPPPACAAALTQAADVVLTSCSWQPADGSACALRVVPAVLPSLLAALLGDSAGAAAFWGANRAARLIGGDNVCLQAVCRLPEQQHSRGHLDHVTVAEELVLPATFSAPAK